MSNFTQPTTCTTTLKDPNFKSNIMQMLTYADGASVDINGPLDKIKSVSINMHFNIWVTRDIIHREISVVGALEVWKATGYPILGDKTSSSFDLGATLLFKNVPDLDLLLGDLRYLQETSSSKEHKFYELVVNETGDIDNPNFRLYKYMNRTSAKLHSILVNNKGYIKVRNEELVEIVLGDVDGVDQKLDSITVILSKALALIDSNIFWRQNDKPRSLFMADFNASREIMELLLLNPYVVKESIYDFSMYGNYDFMEKIYTPHNLEVTK